MRIPKSFMLGGQTFTVEYVSELGQSQDALGICAPDRGTILLQNTQPGYIMSGGRLEQTYLHELTHAILHTMAESDLYGNEKFVDVFATFLHQALTSAKFEEDKDE